MNPGCHKRLWYLAFICILHAYCVVACKCKFVRIFLLHAVCTGSYNIIRLLVATAMIVQHLACYLLVLDEVVIK